MFLIALVIGVLIKSVEKESLISKIKFGPPFELFFIVLFVFAGAGLHLHELIDFAPNIFVLVIARILAKVAGVSVMSHLYHQPVLTGLVSPHISSKKYRHIL